MSSRGSCSSLLSFIIPWWSISHGSRYLLMQAAMPESWGDIIYWSDKHTWRYLRPIIPIHFVTIIVLWIVRSSNHNTSSAALQNSSVRLDHKISTTMGRRTPYHNRGSREHRHQVYSNTFGQKGGSCQNSKLFAIMSSIVPNKNSFFCSLLQKLPLSQVILTGTVSNMYIQSPWLINIQVRIVIVPGMLE